MRDNSERLFAIRNFLTPTHTSKQLLSTQFSTFQLCYFNKHDFPTTHTYMERVCWRKSIVKNTAKAPTLFHIEWNRDEGEKAWWRMWRLGERRKSLTQWYFKNGRIFRCSRAKIFSLRFSTHQHNHVTIFLLRVCVSFPNSFLSLVWVDLIWRYFE